MEQIKLGKRETSILFHFRIELEFQCSPCPAGHVAALRPGGGPPPSVGTLLKGGLRQGGGHVLP